MVMGEAQFLAGYCLLLPDPVVDHLNALDCEQRIAVLEDAAAIGDALLDLCGATRINYEILGNLEPALHVHVFPRYDAEAAALRTKPVWFYDWDNAPKFDATKDAPLVSQIAAYLGKRGLTVERA